MSFIRQAPSFNIVLFIILNILLTIVSFFQTQQVHFRTELSCEKDLNDEYNNVNEGLDKFYQEVNRRIGDLEKAVKQIDKYQYDIQMMKQKLIQEEQLLKTMTSDSNKAENIQVRVCYILSLCFTIHHQIL